MTWPRRVTPAVDTRRGIAGGILLIAASLSTVVALSLPPRPAAVSAPAAPDPTVVAGAFHVHTNRSDGAGSIDEVAAAAARCPCSSSSSPITAMGCGPRAGHGTDPAC